ncbi:GntR family transcriptional regulator [Siccirubricoccus deserti]|uniref:PLP-dependent aminotransferase family protein n=1 Tax=Siccirubricoccus deserti TaxID=2013562 RepID=A0A9X0QVB7_9PROT|nr:PLP-dependent aminotransferase family protein [Siccirubricoccus deserti]MBC4014540.1 PLP-dependent aminotransferase family protein [Siccirubricoccus deserti]GGC32074.1 GntR family transcriptional regulator [Siccirubricoccus deserti]
MKPTHDLSDLLLLAIDRGSGVPALRQVYLEIRRAVLTGVLPPGARLPPSRSLAARLGLARNTVVAAYDQLLAEGIIEGRVGAGSYVSRDLPQGLEPPPRQEGSAAPAAPGALPRAAQRYATAVPAVGSYGTEPCNTGRTSWEERTALVWRGLTLRRLQAPNPAMLGYADPRGSLALRAEIAGYLRAARAVRCEPDQIIVTAGAQQAIDLVLKVLVEPGDPVWVEDPCYPAVRAALAAARAGIVPVPVDAQGLVVAAGIAASPQARLAYVTPSSQYPLGVVLSMARRLELLAWARQAGAFVVEDDYDSEFRYAGRPLAALQGIDDAGRVIYIGTFSKVLFPGLRLGYAVLPQPLLNAVLGARLLSDWHPAALPEAVVTDFIAEGHFAQHLRRMRQHYRRARDTLVEALAGIPALEVEAPEQGMKLVARLRDGSRDIEVAAAAARRGVIARPVSPMFLAAPPMQGLMLGFSGHAPGALRWAARELAACLAG